MKNKPYILVALVLILLLVSVAPPVRAASAADREYKVKVALVYNFIKFLSFPEEKDSDGSDSITIGVIGDDDYSTAFDSIKNKKVKGKNIAIKQFKAFDKLQELQRKNGSRWKEVIKELKKCQVLFICTCEDEKEEIPVELLKALKDSGVLVIGEMPGFLEKGGIINFVMEDGKVKFEVNNAAATRNGLKIRSKLLKLAKRVIKEEKPKGTKN